MQDNEYGTGRKDWMEIFEPSEKDGTLRSNNSVFTPPASCKMKGRNFKGACTKNGYGPVNAPTVTSGGGFTDYDNNSNSGSSMGMSSDGGAMGGMDAGGGMGESNDSIFISFLESMKTDSNVGIIDAVKKGFNIIVEASESKEWASDIEPKEGKMKELLSIPEGKKVSDVYTSGKKLANDLVKALKGDKKKAASMLAFAANIDKQDNVLDVALSNIPK